MVQEWRVQSAQVHGDVQVAAEAGHDLRSRAGGMGGGVANSCQSAGGGTGSGLVAHALGSFESRACSDIESQARKITSAARGARGAIAAIEAGDEQMAANTAAKISVVDSHTGFTSDNGITLSGDGLPRTLRTNG